jgi:hypothetical protein
MSKLIEIKPNINQSALELIEEIKKDVESGVIQSISISYVTKDNAVSSTWSSSNNQLLMWSSIMHCERRFYEEAVLERVE